jgi:RNA polymerase sigma-70 factor (ECF subfamily)
MARALEATRGAALGRGMFAALAERAAADEAMERYAAGDEAAFSLVYDELAPRLHRYLLRHARSASRAEDLLQQTFMHMHRARGSFIRGAGVTPWAFAIARRLLIDGIRRDRFEVIGGPALEVECASTDAGAEALVEARQTAARLERELARLPKPRRPW